MQTWWMFSVLKTNTSYRFKIKHENSSLTQNLMHQPNFFFFYIIEEIDLFKRTYDAQKPHEGEAGGGVMGSVVELGHLVILPSLKSVREEGCSLWVQSTDGLRGEVSQKKKHFLFIQRPTIRKQKKNKRHNLFLISGIDAKREINVTSTVDLILLGI